MAAAAALADVSGDVFLLPDVVCAPRESNVPAVNRAPFDPTIAIAAAMLAISCCVRFITSSSAVEHVRRENPGARIIAESDDQLIWQTLQRRGISAAARTGVAEWHVRSDVSLPFGW